MDNRRFEETYLIERWSLSVYTYRESVNLRFYSE